MNGLDRGVNVLLVAAQVDTETNDVWEGWGSVILVVGIIALVGAIIAMVLWQGMKLAQTRIASRTAIAQDEAYRTLAAQATAAQQKTADEQGRIAQELSNLRARTGELERLLKQVE